MKSQKCPTVVNQESRDVLYIIACSIFFKKILKHSLVLME